MDARVRIEEAFKSSTGETPKDVLKEVYASGYTEGYEEANRDVEGKKIPF